MEEEGLTEEIERLKAKKPTLSDLLISSPFDDKMDIDERLTPKIFYKKLYVEDDYDELAAKLIATINDRITSNNVILVSGYAGTGKSTFLRTFKNKNETAFNHRYLTFDERAMYFSSISTDEEIVNLIKMYLYHEGDIRKTIAFIVANRSTLKAQQLISDKLYEYTSEPKPLDKAGILHMLTSKFNIKDTFTCFFCHVFLNLQNDDTTIIYFDNLDYVKMEFLSGTFLENFRQSLVDANVLRKIGDFARKEISMSNFRFIFCLRDANGALANHHLASRPPFKVVPFKIAFEPAFYQRIIKKRMAFSSEIFDGEGRFGTIPLNTVREFLEQLIEDSYFQKAFLPFFNNDYRTTVKVLLALLKNNEEFKNIGKSLSYISRGNLLFGLIKYALGEDYLKKYKDSEIPLTPSGWCYIDRVVLTVIINRSKYNRGKHNVGSESDLSESYYLVDCIQHLEEFYSVRQTLEAISRCFLYHERGWAHLLTISNINITREKQSGFINEFSGKYAKRGGLEPPVRKVLDDIKIRVTPAGFTFVRYILIHFEFYSNLVNNPDPLSIRESEISDRPHKFQFEEAIDKVLDLVSLHIKSMEKFFNEKYFKVVGSVDSFYTSDYCFRHLGEANIAMEQGYFHSTRIITSHINYIDQFRCEMLHKFKDTDTETLRKINKVLIEKIQAYINMLKNSIDERGKKDFISDFEEAIHAIETDFKKAPEIKIIRKSAPPKKAVVKQLKPK